MDGIIVNLQYLLVYNTFLTIQVIQRCLLSFQRIMMLDPKMTSPELRVNGDEMWVTLKHCPYK